MVTIPEFGDSTAMPNRVELPYDGETGIGMYWSDSDSSRSDYLERYSDDSD